MFRTATFQIVMGAVLVTIVKPIAAADNPGPIVWKSDIMEAYELAKSTQRPMVAYIYSEDQNGLAPYCATLERGSLASREVNFFSKSAVFVKLNSADRVNNEDVKKFTSDLKITHVPFVGVFECKADAITDWGEIHGDIATNDFVAALREYIIRASISIGAHQQPQLSEQELHQHVARCQEEFASLRNKFVAIHAAYLAHQTKLLDRGEFDANEFLLTSRTLSEIQMQMEKCFFEFATLPSDDIREYGRHLMNLNLLMYSQVQFLEEDLNSLAANGQLTGQLTVTMAQTKVREANATVESESLRLNDSLTKAQENFQKKFEGFASN